ncbi:MAG: Rv3654c family TadE-like protein [Nocardioides sp.]
MRRRNGRGDTGSVTLVAVACAGVLLVLGAALGVAAAMVAAHRAAQAAADLSALAAAQALGRGVDPCGVAGAVATANGARLSVCDVAGRDVRVRVTVPGPHWLGQEADLGGEARAGPG